MSERTQLDDSDSKNDGLVNRFYPIAYAMALAFIAIWIVNAMGLLIDGTGGTIVYEGNSDSSEEVDFVNWDLCESDLDNMPDPCFGTVDKGETYPCDPAIDPEKCANSLTLFSGDDGASSMPAGFYTDGILMIDLGVLVLAVTAYVHLIYTPAQRNKLKNESTAEDDEHSDVDEVSDVDEDSGEDEVSDDDSEDSENTYEDLTVVQLKEVLRVRALSTSGKKSDLIARLATDDDASAIEEHYNDDPDTSAIEEHYNDDPGDLVSEANIEMDVDSVFETYDANSDGKIEHSEYVAVHKSEVEKGGVSGFVDRLLDDSPELRGQRLWVMFALSVLLVAAMNAYAMVREPELVKIEDLVEHNNEVVSVEGIVLSWVEDPYSSGENRVNILIEDDTGVAQLRWYRYGDIPMLGTKVTATADVIEYGGKIWLQALGSGALSWDASDIPDAPVIGISTIAENPESFVGEAFTITGYISKSVNPSSTFTSLDLRDHPTYGNHEHQMNMIIHSAPGQWLESGQKVEVTAVIDYSQKFLQWTIHTEGPEIRIVRTHEPTPTTIGWSNYQTWSYNSGSKVILFGQISGDEIIEPGGDLKACLLNNGDLSDYEGKDVNFGGRLIWSTSYAGWCIDSSNAEHVEMIDVSDAENILGQLASNPEDTMVDVANGTEFLINGFVSGATFMSESGDTKIIIADAVYPNTLAKMDAYVPVGQHFGWLEEGQPIVVNVRVSWNSASAELQLMVTNLILTGEPSPANQYDLSEGAPAFYDLNKITSITGNLVIIDDQTYLQKEGGAQKIKINTKFNSIGTNPAHEGLTLKWTGRLIEVADDITLAHHYVLDDADVTDDDGNGIADDAEDA